jgi:hypothetical protein
VKKDKLGSVSTMDKNQPIHIVFTKSGSSYSNFLILQNPDHPKNLGEAGEGFQT